MPWMPEVFTAHIAEARRAEEATRVNDAVPYYEGIMAEEPGALVRSFAGHPSWTILASATWRARGSSAPSYLGRRSGCASATPWWRTWL